MCMALAVLTVSGVHEGLGVDPLRHGIRQLPVTGWT